MVDDAESETAFDDAVLAENNDVLTAEDENTSTNFNAAEADSLNFMKNPSVPSSLIIVAPM